jgi:hypothetical protein
MAFKRLPSTRKAVPTPILCVEQVTIAILSFSSILKPRYFLGRLSLLPQRKRPINLMRKPVCKSSQYRLLALPLLLAALPACASHSVKLVHPRTGVVAECSGSGVGAGNVWVQGYLDDCIRRMESRGYAQVDKLTPEQRLGLESQGLLPKSNGAPAASK